MGRSCNRANKWQSQTGVPLVLAGGWRVRSPRSWPQACTLLGSPRAWCEYWAGLWHTPPPHPSHPPHTRIIYLKRETKPDGMLSCTQCSNSVQCEKAIVENLNQFLCSWAVLWDCVWTTGKDRWKQRRWEQDMQIERTEVCKTSPPHCGYYCCPDTKRTTIPFCGTSVKWLSEAEGSPVLLSCSRLSLGLSHRLS